MVVTGFEVIVYPVIADPPVAPGVIAILALVVSNAVANKIGSCGTVVAVTPEDADEAEDVPYVPVATAV